MTNGKSAIVVGRQLFVDLWEIYGFTPVVCESPGELHLCLDDIADMDAAIVIVEKSWFDKTPASIYRKLAMSKRPVWVPFPDIEPVKAGSEG
jgi:vacuolar-type H+-ATPase subunit F/Vma7